MGTSNSKLEKDTTVYNESSIHFSQDLVNHLSDQLTKPTVTTERQTTLDAHIRARIQAEVARLREQEESVLQEIGQALEKENLDRERTLEGGGSSVTLLHDLDEVNSRLQKFQSRKRLGDKFPEIQSAQDALVQCYRAHPTTTLDCWREVAAFKNAVAKLEHKFVDSLKEQLP